MPTPLDANSCGDEHAGTCFAPPPASGPASAPQSGPQSVPAPVPAPRYSVGAVLSGKYQLDNLLGEGGMGAVWQATNLLLDLPVALKLIRADLDRGSLRARLQLEARSAAKLGHPGIVRVFDVGESEFGDPFIVMELLSGETLAQLLSREQRLSAVYAVQLLLPIIDALAMAHSRGIVHRDLKPDNVMLCVEQHRVQPKILDFGIAKLIDLREHDHRLTEVGTVVGSPDYMSPEQACGRADVDASTDIWSVCVVLYEAIAGVPPFSASNYNALLRAIVEDPPTPFTEHNGGDSALWEVVARGLAKQREQRYRTIAELGQALAQWLLSKGVHEDICGTSLESKWLSRGSDPNLEQPLGVASAPSAGLGPSPARESQPSGVRGPYTATIRPAVAARTRWLGALGVCALLGVAVFEMNRSARVRPGPELTQASPSLRTTKPRIAASPAPLVLGAAATAPTPSLREPALAVPSSSSEPVLAGPVERKPVRTDTATKKASSAVTAVARAPRPAPSSAQEGPAKSAPLSNAATPQRSGAKALDLLTPY